MVAKVRASAIGKSDLTSSISSCHVVFVRAEGAKQRAGGGSDGSRVETRRNNIANFAMMMMGAVTAV